MKVDSGLMTSDLASVPDRARRLEELGFDAAFTGETAHDALFPLLLAAEHTERLELGSSIVVAFARSPMSLAIQANDLQRYSRGRFVLGLGSQVKAHIEKRFSMPWSRPAARMREFVLAMQAVWRAWNEGEKLDFRGEFYRHTLMTPFFSPPPNPFGPPRVWLAAVGDLMTEVAGEVADGMILHPFTTERYAREVTLPAIGRGLARSGRGREGFEISGGMFVVTGDTEEEMAEATRAVKKQIAFYGSTPAYRPVLELHGWGGLQDELNRLSKQGEWDAMGDVVGDDVLDAFAVVAEPDAVGEALRARWGGVLDRIALYALYGPASPERWARVLGAVRG